MMVGSAREAIVATFIRCARAWIATLRLDAAPSMLLAVSGGIDSVALLDLMLMLREELRARVGVAHVDHGLHADSGTTAAFVARLAARRGLPCFVERVDVARVRARGASTEMAAREVRYEALRRLAVTQGFTTVATAHTLSDNLESMLLALVRGGGPRALAGIPPARPLGHDIRVVRPLLCVDRDEVAAYVRARRLRWREDPTNADVAVRRNYLRHRVVPLLVRVNPRAAHAAGHAAGALREVLRVLQPALEETKRMMRLESTPGERLIVAIPSRREYLYYSLRTVALADLLAETFAGPVQADDLARLEALTERQTGARESLSRGLTAVRDRDRIVVACADPASDETVPIAIGGAGRLGATTVRIRSTPVPRLPRRAKPGREVIDADAAGSTFALRRWRPGDAFVPLGLGHRKNVSDFLTDRKISTMDRDRVLVLTTQDRIVWVCGLRLDDRVRVTARTRRALELTMTSPAAVRAARHSEDA